MTTSIAEKKTQLKQAKKEYNRGVSFVENNEYSKAKAAYGVCLTIRESLLGRYDLNTREAYLGIASCFYWSNDDKNAITAFRIGLRIERYLSESIDIPILHDRNDEYETIKESLKGIGLTTEEQIELWDSNLNTSLYHETQGDDYRSKGQYEQAMKCYVKAIEGEKDCIGNEICISYLCRKIAFIHSLKNQSGTTDDTQSIDWIQVDHIDPDNKNICGCSEEVFKLIKDGDIYHALYDISKSLKKYKEAAMWATLSGSTSNEKPNVKIDLFTLSSSSSSSSLSCNTKNQKSLSSNSKTWNVSSLERDMLIQLVEKQSKMQQTFNKTMITIQDFLQSQNDVINMIQSNILKKMKKEKNEINSVIERVDDRLQQFEKHMNQIQSIITVSSSSSINKLDKMDAKPFYNNEQHRSLEPSNGVSTEHMNHIVCEMQTTLMERMDNIEMKQSKMLEDINSNMKNIPNIIVDDTIRKIFQQIVGKDEKLIMNRFTSSSFDKNNYNMHLNKRVRRNEWILLMITLIMIMTIVALFVTILFGKMPHNVMDAISD